MKFQIDNEYDVLEAVLVRRPGREIDRLTHENMRRFLFEDVPYLRRMQDEHDAFVETMRSHNIQVVYLRDLLLDIVKDDRVRTALLVAIRKAEGLPPLLDVLADAKLWNYEELIDVFFAGLTAEEFRDVTGQPLEVADENDFVLAPIPNAYFSRDPAVVVRDAAIVAKMHYLERVRETLLVRAVLENHPEFRDNKITYGGTDEPTDDRPYTIEGGDVIILSPDAVLIGASERTRSETIERLAARCFKDSRVQRVYEVPIPVERAFMHLDTVFTVLDRGTILWYPPVMRNITYVKRYEPQTLDNTIGARRVPEDRQLLDILADEFGTPVTAIDTAGGRTFFASREQRADATNALAIAPRVAITYERNERTTAALEAHGITCIGIDDSELVRGLGGPRCMTMPLRRRAPQAQP